MAFPSDFYDYLKENTLIEIKGGTNRESFLQIWMVQVNHRVFARSWNKSKRSWFTAFVQEGEGEIKYGNKILKVKGKQLLDEPEMTLQINERYLQKYNQPENIYYSQGITQPEYENFTMEFFCENRQD